MKSIEQIQNILNENKARLARQYHVRQLGLFGSWVRNEQTPESDLDLLVTFTKKPSLFQFIELENELSGLLGVKVDLVMESALKPRIGENIRKEVINLWKTANILITLKIYSIPFWKLKCLFRIKIF